MKKTIALVASIAFALGMVGGAAAQTSTAPAPATPAPPAAKDDMKKSDKMDKKADKKADKMADCMTKAGMDEAKKADCEKKYAAKKPAAKTEKK
jgi:hypothetical protein